jgi:anti-sigma factor RsiW
MADRPDIDALLISALYGELTPAEETRLAAHLETHPADRTVLADLTFAREAVRESRFFQLQLEPPQAVSALLLQEAARRAPKVPEEEREGWFARLVRSFAAHPAMAAAAMLVIVVGVTTIVTRNGGDRFATSTAPATGQAAQEAAPPAPAPAKEEAPLANAEGGEDRGGLDDSVASGSAAVDQYRVDLADKDTAKSEKLAVGAKGGIEVHTGTPKPAPRELEHQEAKKAPARRLEESAAFAADEPVARKADDAKAQRDREATVAQGYAKPPGAAPMAPPPPPTVAATPSTTSPAGTGAGKAIGGAPADGRSVDPSLVALHDRIVAQASDDCRAAASTAVALWRRSPAYYDQNVVGDRRLAACKQYIEPAISQQVAERERQQRAKSAETAKRALDQPTTKATTKTKPAKPADSK